MNKHVPSRSKRLSVMLLSHSVDRPRQVGAASRLRALAADEKLWLSNGRVSASLGSRFRSAGFGDDQPSSGFGRSELIRQRLKSTHTCHSHRSIAAVQPRECRQSIGWRLYSVERRPSPAAGAQCATGMQRRRRWAVGCKAWFDGTVRITSCEASPHWDCFPRQRRSRLPCAEASVKRSSAHRLP